MSRFFAGHRVPRRSSPGRFFLAALPAICCLLAGGVGPAGANDDDPQPRLMRPGEMANDRRLGPLKTLNGYFPFTPPKTAEEWAARSEHVRRQILVAAGLWPLPFPDPADSAAPQTTPSRPRRHNVVVHGRIERPARGAVPGYSVERVALESYPGHFVTGSLYRPLRPAQSAQGKAARMPAVLSVHGHLADARFADSGLQEVRKQISVGAERFEVGGRHTEQSRAVQLARMGCVVFEYDMVGYSDSKQLSYELTHRFSQQRPDFEGPERWGFFSAQAEMRAQNLLGLQTYNSLCAVDWVSSLPDVDPERIGVTGSSGGGTQSMLLAAIDPRVKAAFPVVMVSTSMQGGCTCENASLLRVDTGNIEFAALCAPRALGMCGANDWTLEIETKGLPELKQLYELLGAREQVMGKALSWFPHNYNYVTREVMYQFFNRHFRLGLESPVIEEDFQPLDRSELTVWDAEHPRPPSGPDYERSLVATITQDAERSLAALAPRDSGGMAKFREIVGGAVDVIVGRGLPGPSAIQWDVRGEENHGDYTQFKGWLRDPAHGEELPVVFLHPYSWKRRVVIWLTPKGKDGMFFPPGGQPRPEVIRLVKAGITVVGVDLLYQGELIGDGGPLVEARKVDSPREFAGFTLGYNSALPAQRAHDVLAVISFCRNYQVDKPGKELEKPEEIMLVATEGAAPYAAAALAQAGGAVDRAAIDTAGFRFASIRSIRDLNLLPAVVKYGDLPGLLALAAPCKLWLAGESGPPPLTQAAYAASGAADRVQLYSGPAAGKRDAMLEWLIR